MGVMTLILLSLLFGMAFMITAIAAWVLGKPPTDPAPAPRHALPRGEHAPSRPAAAPPGADRVRLPGYLPPR